MRGETVYVGDTAVDNVLVSSGGVNKNDYNAIEIAYPVGPVADYTLYFPIDCTEDLAGKKVTVRGIDCEVIGYPDHERPQQVFDGWLGQWDMSVKVKRTMAEYAESITVNKTVVTRDDLGRRTATTTAIYTGSAQVRLATGSETDKSKATTERETRYFVFPWKTELAGLQTQEVSIEWDNRTWDVKSINNVDEKSETASIEAVWHG